MKKNPNLITPSKEEMLEINTMSFRDAEKGVPAGYDVTDDDIKKHNSGEKPLF